MADIIIETINLTKRFKTVTAVNNVNLAVKSGETFGLIGPNGAGKTTTIRLLTGVIKPTSGTARIDQYDIINDTYMVKRITGLLPESPGLYEKLTAREFLEFIGSLYDVPKDTLSERINELIALFKLEERQNDLLEGYSRGMKQKVLLASTLVHDPLVLFFDEPTSNLDPMAARMVKNMINQLSKKAGKTIFISTHALADVQELCDRLALIAEGRIVEVGSPKELMDKTETDSVEKAYLKIMGGYSLDRDLLSWRQ
ncbi:MAG: ABC transporter ATP-binding protein [Candidatus Odinarchaeia archaeon]